VTVRLKLAAFAYPAWVALARATLTMPAAGAWELTVQQGGLPIIKDGKVIGGIGSGGSSAANDEKFVQAGLDAVK